MFSDNMTLLLSSLTYFEFVSVLSHHIATYDTHASLILYPNKRLCFFYTNDYYLSITRFHDESITTCDPSFGVILLGHNKKKVLNPYFFLMNLFLTFQTTVLLGEKLAKQAICIDLQFLFIT